MTVQKINLAQAFASFDELWSPRIAAEVNDTQVKLARIKGEFVWHYHETEDELFFVVKGSLLIRLRDGDLRLEEGEMAVIPHGVEHQPVAENEVWLLLVEPAGTLNTGNVIDERTVDNLQTL